MLELGPGGSDAELQPARREVVDGHRHLREHGRVPVGVAGHHAADAHALRRLRHRPQEHPALEHVERRIVDDRGEVVEDPEVIEVGLVGQLPDRAELRGIGVLLRELEADPQGVHGTSLAATCTRPRFRARPLHLARHRRAQCLPRARRAVRRIPRVRGSVSLAARRSRSLRAAAGGSIPCDRVPVAGRPRERRAGIGTGRLTALRGAQDPTARRAARRCARRSRRRRRRRPSR